MFAAASGARLAHRHNKAVKKQISASQIEGLHVQYKGFQRQHQLRYPDVHGSRYAGVGHRRQSHAAKPYSANCDPGLRLSSSFLDINGRISKLGRVDFEGKAAWQDREVHEPEARESICVPSEAAVTHRTKQREAHRRWVKRNRIHDLSFEDCSSEDEEILYGVQNGAANLLLYVGLGTMCVGMIIAFVGTGEKGFKTMELRLIGPSLIGAGVLIIILRVMLCVCPSKCLRLRKQKHKLKNSTNKLNSEGNETSQELSSSKEPPGEGTRPPQPEEGKKRVSIAMLPTTSGLSTNSSEHTKAPKTPTYPESPRRQVPLATVSFLEFEKPTSSKASPGKLGHPGVSEGEGGGNADFELRQLRGSNLDVTSFGSQTSSRGNFSDVPETLPSPDGSDISITSIVEVSPLREGRKEAKASKFEMGRSPKNRVPTEIVLSPSNLNEAKESE